MPLVWIKKKTYSVDPEVADYVERLEADIERLKDAVRIARIKLEVIKTRAKAQPNSKGDKPIWITAKNGLKEIEQALKDSKRE